MITFIDHKNGKVIGKYYNTSLKGNIKVNLDPQDFDMDSRYLTIKKDGKELYYHDTKGIVEDGLFKFFVTDNSIISEEDSFDEVCNLNEFRDDVIIATLPTFNEIISDEDLIEIAMSYSTDIGEFFDFDDYLNDLLDKNAVLNISFLAEGFFFNGDSFTTFRFFNKTKK